MSEAKIYVGNGKENKAGGIRIPVNVTKLLKAIKDGNVNTYTNEKTGDQFAIVNVWANKGADQFGNTHTMVCDNFKPDGDAKKAIEEKAKYVINRMDNNSDLPF